MIDLEKETRGETTGEIVTLRLLTTLEHQRCPPVCPSVLHPKCPPATSQQGHYKLHMLGTEQCG